MLGEEKTEQFIITVEKDGKLIREQRIHDPFIHNTTTIGISRWDLFKAIFRKQYEIKLEVSISGTWGVQRAIMSLDPKELDAQTQKMRDEKQSSGGNNFCLSQ